MSIIVYKVNSSIQSGRNGPIDGMAQHLIALNPEADLPVHLVASPEPRDGAAILPLVSALALPAIIEEPALERVPVLPVVPAEATLAQVPLAIVAVPVGDHRPSALLAAVGPLAIVYAVAHIPVDALAMLDTLLELSFVYVSISESVDAVAVEGVVLELAIVGVAVVVADETFALLDAVMELALVLVAIGVGEDAPAGGVVADEVALIQTAVRVDYPALAALLVVVPAALVAVPIGVDENTEAVPGIVLPLALVLLPSAKVLVDALSVPEIVGVGAFVDVAVLHVHLALALLFPRPQVPLVKLASREGVHSLPVEIVRLPVAEVLVAVLAGDEPLACPLALAVELPHVLVTILQLLPCYSSPEVPGLINDVLPPEDLVEFVLLPEELGSLFLGGDLLVPLQHHDVDVGVAARVLSLLDRDGLVGSALGEGLQDGGLGDERHLLIISSKSEGNL